jgi:hypothetical protein
MKSTRRLRAMLLASAFIFSTNVLAQTMETNINGLVIKEYRCLLNKWVQGNLINRNVESFNGNLRLKVIDNEGDIIFQNSQPIKLSGQNGVGFEVALKVGTCMAPNKIQITLE